MRISILFHCLFSLLILEMANASPEGERILSIGVLTPLSGGPAEQGRWVLQGAELAKDFLEKSGVKIRLRVEDTQGDPKLAISAFRKLETDGRLDAVITYGSGVGMALSPLANQSKVIQMGVATSTPAYRSPEDFNFRNFPSAELEAAFLVQQAIKLNKTPQVAVVRINNEYGLGTAKAFAAQLEKSGGSVLLEETLEPSGSDYRPIIARMKSKTPGIIYLGVYPIEGALFLKQSKELGLNVPMIASVAILGAKNFFDLAGGGAEGLFVASSTPVFLENSSAHVKSFVDGFKRMYNEEPSVEQIYAARSYDALRIIAKADQSCPPHDSECLKEKLFSSELREGPSGDVSFDRNGDVLATFRLLQLRGQSFQFADLK